MSRKEAPRAGLVKAALAGQITTRQGAGALGLTARQFRRLKARYRAEGPPGLRHRLRGRPSPRALEVQLRDRVADLMQTLYWDLNDCHLTEKLQEVEGLELSRSSVRRIRRALGRPAKHRRRPRQHRRRRTPEAQMGALVQLDGSPFDWLEGRGPALTLLGAIDDATGTVLALQCRPTEDLHGYATLLRQVALQYGLPLALYGDRLSVFVRNDRHWTLEEELQGAQHPTHFGVILRDLGIGYIPAGSPQAKGRIERLWRTLQDRLVVELRLHGIRTLEAAQAFLPEFLADFNPRFAHAPAAADAWRRPPRDLAAVLSCRYTRVVARDHTVRLAERLVQVPPGPHGRSYAGCRVEVREGVDGQLLVLYQGQPLVRQPAPGPEFVLRPRRAPHGAQAPRRAAPRRTPEAGGDALLTPRPRPSAPVHRPPAPRPPASAHPWRRPFTRRGREIARTSKPGRTFSWTS